MTFLKTIAAIILVAFPLSAKADSLKERLQKFKANPKAVMNSMPEKKSVSGKKAAPLFTDAQIKSKAYLKAKSKFRKGKFQAPAESNDLAENIVDDGGNMITSLEDMAGKELLKGETESQPWSDYYWAIYQGLLGFRYADSRFPGGTDWKAKADFLNSEDAKSSSVDFLSPAEKYDLLVGDSSKSLTNYSLRQGSMYYSPEKGVETWMGVCHGWAPASYMIERPTSAIRVMAADGTTMITFYPADLKALSTLLWANSSPGNRFVGGRCNTKNPEQDENGRLKEQSCFDTNPATWHLAVVNQIGVHKRPMVMDATFDYEVWNQPIRSYQYTYFNPATLNPAEKLEDAKVEVKDFTADKFSKYRSPETKYVVGVSMALTYIRETMPSQQDRDTAANDALYTVSYEYDLELNEKNQIIGGEWYRNAHPDFLWTPEKGAKAMTAEDSSFDSSEWSKEWDGKTAFPKEWAEKAPGAARRGSPLSLIVEKLVKLSRTNLGM